MSYRIVVATAFVGLVLVGASAESKWPQFRGLQAGVAADDPSLPDTWGPTEGVVWKTEIPGVGWGSPIVWDEHVFVTSAVNGEESTPPKARVFTAAEVASTKASHRWMLYDVDFKTGKIRWEREVGQAVPQAKHMKNSYASETPATDGERVYAYFGSAGMFAFNLAGRAIWAKPMGPFKMRSDWGPGASPIVYKSRVYVVNDNEEQSFIAAYEAKTGKEVWRLNRDEHSNWSTPVVWENDVRTEIVTTGSNKLRSYDLDGKLLWEMSGLSSLHVPTPFAAHGLLFVNSGFRVDQNRPVFVIRPGATGDISLKPGETSNRYIVWRHPTLGSYNPSSLVYGGYYYTLYDTSFLTCHDAVTGKEVYGRQRISAESTGFSASPWAYNGKIFVMSEDGDTFVIQPGPEFKVLRKNSLNEMTLATPAVADGSLIVRTASKLYRIGKSGGR